MTIPDNFISIITYEKQLTMKDLSNIELSKWKENTYHVSCQKKVGQVLEYLLLKYYRGKDTVLFAYVINLDNPMKRAFQYSARAQYTEPKGSASEVRFDRQIMYGQEIVNDIVKKFNRSKEKRLCLSESKQREIKRKNYAKDEHKKVDKFNNQYRYWKKKTKCHKCPEQYEAVKETREQQKNEIEKYKETLLFYACIEPNEDVALEEEQTDKVLFELADIYSNIVLLQETIQEQQHELEKELQNYNSDDDDDDEDDDENNCSGKIVCIKP